MNKFIFLAILFSATSIFAAGDDIDLSEHGKDLMKAPFAARYHFYNTYQKDWMDSDYGERQRFLTSWHRQINEERKMKKAHAKEESDAFKARQKEKAYEKKKQKEKLKAQAAKIKSEQKELDRRNKEFDHAVKSQEKQIERLQRSER